MVFRKVSVFEFFSKMDPETLIKALSKLLR